MYYVHTFKADKVLDSEYCCTLKECNDIVYAHAQGEVLIQADFDDWQVIILQDGYLRWINCRFEELYSSFEAGDSAWRYWNCIDIPKGLYGTKSLNEFYQEFSTRSRLIIIESSDGNGGGYHIPKNHICPDDCAF